jgi:predicted transcriptional regulator
MEVHFTPEVQAKLDRMAQESGCPSEELVEDAVIGYFDELAYTREMLDRRCDDLDSGRVKPIDGEEAFQRLMERTEAKRRQPA